MGFFFFLCHSNHSFYLCRRHVSRRTSSMEESSFMLIAFTCQDLELLILKTCRYDGETLISYLIVFTLILSIVYYLSTLYFILSYYNRLTLLVGLFFFSSKPISISYLPTQCSLAVVLKYLLHGKKTELPAQLYSKHALEDYQPCQISCTSYLALETPSF